MRTYRLKKPTTTPDGNLAFTSHGLVTLSDDARGADRYLSLKRQGFTLERVDSAADSQEAS